MTNNDTGVEEKVGEAPADQEGVNTQPAPADAGSGEINYGEELRKLTEEKDNYKEGLLLAKQKLKKLKAGEEEEIDEEALSKKIDELVSQRIESLSKDLASETIDNTIASMTSNEAERKLIKYHYDNSIKITGITSQNIKADLENARVLANRAKVLSETEAMKAALLAGKATSSAGIGSGAPQYMQEQVKLTPAEQSLYTRHNARRQARGEKPLTPAEFVGRK